MHKRDAKLVKELGNLMAELRRLKHPGEEEQTEEEMGAYEQKITGYESRIDDLTCKVMDHLQGILYGDE